MKNLYSRITGGYLIAIALAIFLVPSCSTSKKAEKAEVTGIDEAYLQDFERTKDLSTGTVPRERLLAAVERQNEIFGFGASQRAVPGISWEERGPNNVGGRIRAVMIDKNDASNKKVWVGGVGGGIWYTNDVTAASPVWVKVNDFLDNLAISDLIQDPTTPNTMYASTGEGFFNIDAQQGLGIFKSTDAGLTWTTLANTANFEYVQDLEIDNSGKLYAAVRSSTTAVSGIMRSSDGGATWVQVLTTATSSSNRGCDLEISKDGDMYATLGLFNNGGIYRSPAGATVGNAGTWTNITPNPTTGAIEAPNNQWARIKLAASPSDNNVVYAVFQGGSASVATLQNNCRSIQQYNAGANTWTVRTVPTIIDQNSIPANYPIFTREQAWYDLTAAVDPNNAATLYVSGIDAIKSTNNGATWNQISVWTNGGNEQAAGFTGDQVVHADQHNFVFVGGSSSTAILATDGGISYTTNVNTGTHRPTFVYKNNGLNVTQLYAAAMHPTAGVNYFLDGTQDNGSHKYTTAGLNNVTTVTGGDGGFCHISQINSNNQITSFTNNNYSISTNGGTSFTTAVASNNRGSFINPTDYDGINLYGGDAAGNFFRFLDPQGNIATGTQVAVTNFSGGTVTHVSISNLTAHRVYFGLSNGRVVRVNSANTLNAGVITGTPRSGSVSCIASRPTNEDSMLVSYSNYGGNKIYVSANGTAAAATFTNITGNLPDMPVRWVMFDPRSHRMVIAATELGVWSCDDITVATPQWTITSSGLARTRVDMLKYRSSDRTLLAATHGRGLFSTTFPTNLNPEINFNLSALSIGEQNSKTTNTCQYYTDYSAALTINGAPTGSDATATLAVAGTATEGRDYDILVNDVVTKTIIIPNGTTDSKPFTIRVYDDAIAEGSETLNLSVSSTGGGSSIGAARPTLSITITDNDVAIVGPTTAAISTIGDATGTGGSFYSPFWGNNQSDAKLQTVLLASELTAAGLVAGSNITELTLRVTAKNSTLPFNSFNISLAHTGATPTTGSGFLSTTGLTSCYSNAAYSTTAGDNVFVFSTPFVWDGVSNVVTLYCFDNTVNSSVFDNVDSKPAALGASIKTTLVAASNAAANLNGCTTTPTNSFFPTDGRPVTKFKHYKPGGAIETVAGNSKVEFLPLTSSAYDFLSVSGKVIAKVANPAQALGCVSASVTSAGNGVSTAFFSGMRSSKSWTLTPTTNGSTAGYAVTLYMTTAELAGADPSLFKIYKSSAATLAGANTSNTVTATTTVSQNAEWTSFTANFTGFSLFFIGNQNIVLPIDITNFSGVRSANVNNLSWKNSNGSPYKYDVERSYDGINYKALGTVNAVASSNAYNFTDNAAYAGKAYYRLKIYAADGSYTYSYTISINAGKDNPISVYPSPAKTEVVVSMGDNSLIRTYMTIVDSRGAVVKKVLLASTQQQVSLDGLPAGMYYFRFTNKATIKIIKE